MNILELMTNFHYLVITRCNPASFLARTSGLFSPLLYTIAVKITLKYTMKEIRLDFWEKENYYNQLYLII